MGCGAFQRSFDCRSRWSSRNSKAFAVNSAAALSGILCKKPQASPAESVEEACERIGEHFGLLFREPSAHRIDFRVRRAPGEVACCVIDGRKSGVVVNRAQDALDLDRKDQRDPTFSGRAQSDL